MQIYGNKVNCDEDDLNWITETVGKIPHKQLMIGVLNKYSTVYSSAEGGTLQLIHGLGFTLKACWSR